MANGRAVLVLAFGEHDNLRFLHISLLVRHQNSPETLPLISWKHELFLLVNDCFWLSSFNSNEEQHLLAKLDEMEHDIMLNTYWFVFGISYFDSLQKQSYGTFLKKVFLKILQNWQENSFTGVYFLSAISNFNNEEAPALCFQSLWLFSLKAPSHMFDWVINTPLCYLPI